MTGANRKSYQSSKHYHSWDKSLSGLALAECRRSPTVVRRMVVRWCYRPCYLKHVLFWSLFKDTMHIILVFWHSPFISTKLRMSLDRWRWCILHGLGWWSLYLQYFEHILMFDVRGLICFIYLCRDFEVAAWYEELQPRARRHSSSI